MYRNKISPTPFSLDHQRYPSLDGLRGISIIMVLLSHLFFMNENILLRVFSGDLGVHIFFVISGFLITTLLLRERHQTNSISLKDFYVRRFLRIFPVAYLFLLVLAVLNFIFKLKIPGASFLSSALYIRNTSLIHASDWYTGHFWSLSVEEQFYLIFPFLLKEMNIKKYVLVLITLLLVIPIVHFAVVHKWSELWFLTILDQLIKNMTGILIGSLAAIFFYFGVLNMNFFLKRRLLFSLSFFFIGAIIHSNILFFIPTSFTTTLSSILIALLILINIHKDERDIVFRILNNRYLTYIGVLSYSLYIWQQIFLNNMPWSNLFIGSDSKLVNLILLCVVSFISYNFFEKFFLKIKLRFKKATFEVEQNG